MTDDLSAILAEMAERERLVAMGHVRDPQDVPRLLALARAVLKLADDAVPVDRDYGGEPIWWSPLRQVAMYETSKCVALRGIIRRGFEAGKAAADRSRRARALRGGDALGSWVRVAG